MIRTHKKSVAGPFGERLAPEIINQVHLRPNPSYFHLHWIEVQTTRWLAWSFTY